MHTTCPRCGELVDTQEGRAQAADGPPHVRIKRSPFFGQGERVPRIVWCEGALQPQ